MLASYLNCLNWPEKFSVCPPRSINTSSWLSDSIGTIDRPSTVDNKTLYRSTLPMFTFKFLPVKAPIKPKPMKPKYP
jgi:hypothetical protein